MSKVDQTVKVDAEIHRTILFRALEEDKFVRDYVRDLVMADVNAHRK